MREVVFISHSHKKGIQRATAVLDRYARRIGPDTWSTSITQEGLDATRAALARIATRQVSVSCFWKTPHGLEMAWSIGRAIQARPDGSIPVHEHIAPPPPPPPSVRTRALLVRAAGLAHDLGKASEDFQAKLSASKPIADKVRHEWLSTLMLPALLEGKSWEEAWQHAQNRVSTASALSSNNTVFGKHPSNLGEESPSSGAVSKAVSAGVGTGISSAMAALSFVVATHHRLPGWKRTSNLPNHTNDGAPCLDTFFRLDGKGWPDHKPKFRAMPEKLLDVPIKKLRTTFQRVQQQEDALTTLYQHERADYWFAQALLARPALILADHEQSSVDRRRQRPQDTKNNLFANTRREPGKPGSGELNQLLEWHLGAVGTAAEEIVRQMHMFRPPGLSPMRLAGLLTAAQPGPYDWQNIVADHLAKLPSGQPTLMMNMAGTGCGKTRMNLRALAQVNPEGRPFRVATALNLRSLTLQTIDAYRDELGLGDEIAGVIGDRTANMLHDVAKKEAKSTTSISDDVEMDEDGNPAESEFTPAPGGARFEPPAWLSHALEGRGKTQLKNVIMAPVVACTADFLVAAGDLPKQGNQAVAMMRLLQSDLVLDEVDSYEPGPLVSIMRMVTISAMAARNVIVSSATLSEGCAEAIFYAWHLGLRLRLALLKADGFLAGDARGSVVMFDHATPPQQINVEPGNPPDFMSAYRDYLAGMVKAMRNGYSGGALRLAELLPMEKEGSPSQQLQSWHTAIGVKTEEMHARHAQTIAGKTVSIGLVRVARIRSAIDLSKYLTEQTDADGNPKFQVACYHAGLALIQRNHLEKNLDLILRRKLKDGADPITTSKALLESIEKIQGQHGRFVLVATPVEEIGRDHDFDWGIIEPSSTQSIVQASGRINRHRQQPCPEDKPNVAIMEYNRAALDPIGNKPKQYLIFSKPGLDVLSENPYSVQAISLLKEKPDRARWAKEGSMRGLLEWPQQGGMPMDAGLKFELDDQGKPRHTFSELDNNSTKALLGTALMAFEKDPLKPMHRRHLWGCADFYRYYCLRPREIGQWQVEFEVMPMEKGGRPAMRMHYYCPEKKEFTWEAAPGVKIEERVSRGNDWLVMAEKDAQGVCRRLGLSHKEAFSIPTQVRHISDKGNNEKRWHASFGLGPCPD